MVNEYFLPLCHLSVFLSAGSSPARVLNFDEVQFINISFYGINSRALCLALDSEYFLLVCVFFFLKVLHLNP